MLHLHDTHTMNQYVFCKLSHIILLNVAHLKLLNRSYIIGLNWM